jgi:hypothetical protein
MDSWMVINNLDRKRKNDKRRRISEHISPVGWNVCGISNNHEEFKNELTVKKTGTVIIRETKKKLIYGGVPTEKRSSAGINIDYIYWEK